MIKKNDKNPIKDELSLKFQEKKSNVVGYDTDSADEKKYRIPNITLISDNIHSATGISGLLDLLPKSFDCAR